MGGNPCFRTSSAIADACPFRSKYFSDAELTDDLMRNGRGVGTFHCHIPALAVLARSSGQGDFDVKTIRVPSLSCGIRPNLHHVGFQEVIRGPVVAVLALNPAVERKLMKRTHVKLERR